VQQTEESLGFWPLRFAFFEEFGLLLTRMAFTALLLLGLNGYLETNRTVAMSNPFANTQAPNTRHEPTNNNNSNNTRLIVYLAHATQFERHIHIIPSQETIACSC
jgi:hypothetical protein